MATRPKPGLRLLGMVALAAVSNQTLADTTSHAPVFGYRVIATYEHDPNAFTQGLAFDNGFFYEGTGLKGHSSVRRIDIAAKRVLRLPLPKQYFGEGITLYGGKIYQLTWRAHTGFVYDKNSLKKLGQFSYDGEGWGITTDGTSLIMSNGSAQLYFLNPRTYTRERRVEVKDGDTPVEQLNELEFIKDEIYANVWESDRIVRISPDTGRVTAWIDLRGLEPQTDPHRAVLNGIAYDAQHDRLFVTGKLWSHIYEIELVPPADDKQTP